MNGDQNQPPVAPPATDTITTPEGTTQIPLKTPAIPPVTPPADTPPVAPTTPPATPPPVVPPVAPPPATPTVPPVAPVTTPPVEPPTTPPVDQKVDIIKITEEIKKEVTGEVSKNVIQKIVKALGLTKEEELELPKNPTELLKIIRKESAKTTEDALKSKEKEQTKTQQEETERQKQVSDSFVKLWTNQYNQLAESNRVPKIVNANDANDPGRVAKNKILLRLHQIIKDNETKGIDYVPTLKEVFYENPDILKGVAGANTPVSGGGRTTTATQGMGYPELHNTPMSTIVEKAVKEST